MSYKAGIQAKLNEAREAAGAGDFDTGCDLLDGIADEAHELAKDTIKVEDAERFIAEVEQLREKWECP